MNAAPPAAGAAPAPAAQLVPFAFLSASYFAHIGFFNPYLPLWLKSLGLPILVISMLAATQSFTRVFAPYAWGALSDRTGERVRLLRYGAGGALIASLGLWWNGGPVWLGVVLLVVFVHTSSMMSLTEAAMAHLVAGDWGRYGRIRLWGSAGFLVTVFIAGAWFEFFGMRHFPMWTFITLLLVFISTLRLPDVRETPAHHDAAHEPMLPVLRRPAVRWFFGALLFHVMAHFAIYAFLSLYLDSLGYGKAMIGALWAVSVLMEVVWFYMQGRFIGLMPMTRWLVLCAALTTLRMAFTGGLGDFLFAILIGQLLHAFTFGAHHAACIALVSHYFPGRLRGRGQALFTVTGYGLGGMAGVLAGGAIASTWGFEAMYWVATALGFMATLCAWKVYRAENPKPQPKASATA